ncbi:hypothetical protein FSP39_020359 [Pinctada imbricata]|uniref:L-Fucosyltransferase n=1 Tax=Pinctada imbricata TaxID=66713 RepID=A0AA88YKY0_PINIB|nr:hypothetical protein FSP39_020359 [Pinctada imbricata]
MKKLYILFTGFVFSLLTCFLLLSLLFTFGGQWNVVVFSQVSIPKLFPDYSGTRFEEPKPKAVFIENESNDSGVPKPGQQTKQNSIANKTLSTKATTLKPTTTLAPSTTTNLKPTTTLTKAKPTTSSKTTILTAPKMTPVPTTPKPVSKRYYVCANRVGGLGNNLFQFATSFGVAFSKDMTAVTPQRGAINAVFNLTKNRWLEIAPDNSLCRGSKGRGEKQASGFDPNLINFKADSSYTLTLYLQSWRYFNDSIPELRKQLIFRSNVQNRANAIFDNILKKLGKSKRSDVIFIAIHIRRGDMVNNGFGYQVATGDYIKRAVKYFSNITNRIFVVCSNDLNWGRNNIPGDEKVEYVTGNPREVDFAILASCDHIITTVGSFSWWAGFLNKGTVLYFKWPAKEGSRLRHAYSKDYSDYFLPHWIGL